MSSEENESTPSPPRLENQAYYPQKPPSRWPWVLAFMGIFFCVIWTLLAGLAGVVNEVLQPPKPGLEAYEELTLRNGTSQDKIAVINVEGVISRYSFDGSGQNMVKRVSDQLKLAKRDPAVKAVLLKVDSPGGEVMASDNIHDAILAYTEETGEPVICCMTGIAASGGYYVAAPCRYIVAHELTITGSIGVIMQTVNIHGVMEKVGAKPYTITSGKNKDAMSSFKPPKEIDENDDAKVFRELVAFYFDRFKKIVREGRAAAQKNNANNIESLRGRILDAKWETLADGRVITGQQALDNGFVDQLGTFDDAVKVAEQLSGISGEAQLVRYRAPFDLAGALRFFVKNEDPKLKVDLGVKLPRLDPGRPYYLSPVIYR